MSDRLSRDIASGSNPERPIRRRLRRWRAWVEKHPGLRFAYRLFVGILGSTIAVIGLLLVPLPGPGWLVVFLGAAILGTEFPAAKRFATFLKGILTRVWAWWRARRARRARRSRRSADASPTRPADYPERD